MNDPNATRRRKDRGSFIGTFAYLLLGPCAWALHLAVIYGVQSTLCARVLSAAPASGPGIVTLFVIVVTGVLLLALAVALWRPDFARGLLGVSDGDEPERSFQDSVMRVLAVLSLAGIAWAGSSALIVAPCANLR